MLRVFLCPLPHRGLRIASM
uniref:Uncharacterized protein n=1 Tax=Arundo donax TaxID=35708 RepID=A0A0A9HS17_ARUDO